MEKVPHGHWKTLTFLVALRHNRIDAPYVLDGPINGEHFFAWTEKCLVPTLSPGDVVVMDNLDSHKARPSAGRSERPVPTSTSCHLSAPT